MLNVILLLLSLGIILLGAEVFTNGIEWLGKKLNLAEGAVGSILAAVGTALPETMIPIIAIVFGGAEGGHDIGIGAILGAPFMLSTLAFFVTGIAGYLYRSKRESIIMRVDPEVMGRDLFFFLLVYSVAILAAFVRVWEIRAVIAGGLVIAYLIYVFFTLRSEKTLGEDHQLNPLLFARKHISPPLYRVVLQVLFALGLIIFGADIFVEEIKILATSWGIPPFILALIIAPIATELPEKFNSIIWIGQGKDTLALGNITGAMVFQSSIIPALGILLTDWSLTNLALLSAVLAIASASLVYYEIKVKKHLTPAMLMFGGMFYLVFIICVITGFVR